MYKSSLQIVIVYKHLCNGYFTSFDPSNKQNSIITLLTTIFYIYNKYNHILHYLHHNKCTFIVNYLLLYVLIKFWCKLPEDGDNAETCRS